MLKGVEVGGFRSLRRAQRLSPLTKVNLLAGQNNSGKSNILTFLERFLTPEDLPPREWHDQPVPAAGEQLTLAYGFDLPSFDQLASIAPGLNREAFHRDLRHTIFSRDTELVWLEFSAEATQDSRPNRWHLNQDFLGSLADALGPMAFGNYSTALASMSGGGRTEDFNRVLSRIFPLEASTPKVGKIDAFRQITESGEASVNMEGSATLNGVDLARLLDRLQRPPAQIYTQNRSKYEDINRFARSIFDDPEVRIEVSAGNEISVWHNRTMLPLSSLGTGLHQVLILAVAATTLDDTLLLIEEPEVHLHPLMQRQLIGYLCANTTTQYLIATHSAHMLNHPDVTVFHVTRPLPESTTLISLASTPQSISNICADLGYRASDLIQTNAIVWVEGPSDRIYVNFWLNKVAPDFVEGVHYSIMFYGGSLLSHLKADDVSVSEFISLRRLNRNVAVIIDSDKQRDQGEINETKRRVISELEEAGNPGMSWVTSGRTVENYVPNPVLTEAVAVVHPSANYHPPASQWDNPLSLTSQRSGERMQPDKNAIAREAIAKWDGGPLDDHLMRKVQELAAFIATANGRTAIVQ